MDIFPNFYSCIKNFLVWCYEIPFKMKTQCHVFLRKVLFLCLFKINN